MKRIMLISLLLTSLLATPDVNKEYVVRHRLQLTEVTCNHDCGFVQGITEEPFTDIDGVESCRYRYADDVINMTWYASEIAFNFSFVNKLDKDMTLLWNDMRVQVFEGERVALGNTMQKPRQFVAAEVRAHSGTSGFLIPLNDYPVNKTFEPIMPIVPGQYVQERKARKAAGKPIGKKIYLTFPVHVGDEDYVYELTFVVGKAEAIIYREMGEEDVVTPMGSISSSKDGGSR